jgi:hypothetical protein
MKCTVSSGTNGRAIWVWFEALADRQSGKHARPAGKMLSSSGVSNLVISIVCQNYKFLNLSLHPCTCLHLHGVLVLDTDQIHPFTSIIYVQNTFLKHGHNVSLYTQALRSK